MVKQYDIEGGSIIISKEEAKTKRVSDPKKQATKDQIAQFRSLYKKNVQKYQEASMIPDFFGPVGARIVQRELNNKNNRWAKKPGVSPNTSYVLSIRPHDITKEEMEHLILLLKSVNKEDFDSIEEKTIEILSPFMYFLRHQIEKAKKKVNLT